MASSDLKRLRSSLTLDIHENLGTKAKRLGGQIEIGEVLSSPDVKQLKLATPELDQLVLQQYNLQQQQHHHENQQQQRQELYRPAVATTLCGQWRNLTEEQGLCVNALLQLPSGRATHQENSTIDSDAISAVPVPLTVSAAMQKEIDLLEPLSNRRTYNTGSQWSTHHDKRLHELTRSTTSVSGEIAVDTSPLSPINMADQERIKLERKRARNREAAARCRNRKLEKIDQLQEQADELRKNNSRLSEEVRLLRKTVFQLRQDILKHSNCLIADGLQIPSFVG